ncbi:hypothetical protein ACTFIR_007260 [Dictyostelium discoideum]
MKNIILPNYIQKNIISKIIYDYYKTKKELIENQEKSNKEKFIFKTLTRVCWYWFTTISNRIDILDYRFTNIIPDNKSNNKYCIIKKSNIKYLIINQKKFKHSQQLKEYYEKLNLLIIELKSLKRILIDVIYESEFVKTLKLPNENIIKITISNIPYSDLFQLSQRMKFKEIIQIKPPILSDENNPDENNPDDDDDKKYEKNKNDNNFYSNFIKSRIKPYGSEQVDHVISVSLDKLKTISQNPYTYIELLSKIKINYFECHIYSIKNYFNQQDYQTQNLSTYFIPFKEVYLINPLVFNSIKGYSNSNIPISIEQLYYLLKSSPNINCLFIDICFDNLIYLILNYNNNDNDNNKTKKEEEGQQQQQQYFPCRFCKNKYNNNDSIEQWNFIYNEIRNHKKLKIFSISNGCSYDPNDLIGQFQETEFPTQFIEIIGSMILNNTSIETLFFDFFHTTQLLEFIYLNNKKKNNNNNNNILRNKTIRNLHCKFRNSLKIDKNKYQLIVNEIVKENSQILEIKVNEIDEDFNYLDEIASFPK